MTAPPESECALTEKSIDGMRRLGSRAWSLSRSSKWRLPSLSSVARLYLSFALGISAAFRLIDPSSWPYSYVLWRYSEEPHSGFDGHVVAVLAGSEVVGAIVMAIGSETLIWLTSAAIVAVSLSVAVMALSGGPELSLLSFGAAWNPWRANSPHSIIGSATVVAAIVASALGSPEDRRRGSKTPAIR